MPACPVPSLSQVQIDSQQKIAELQVMETERRQQDTEQAVTSGAAENEDKYEEVGQDSVSGVALGGTLATFTQNTQRGQPAVQQYREQVVTSGAAIGSHTEELSVVTSDFRYKDRGQGTTNNVCAQYYIGRINIMLEKGQQCFV